MLTASDIIFQDEVLVAINKPAGLLVHPSFMDKSETESAMKQLRDLLNCWVYPVHRLDKPTSGVLLFSLNKETARVLCDSFMEHQVQKTYLAVVRGFTRESEIIDYPLKRIYDKMTDRPDKKDQPPQEAITRYERLETVELPIPMPPHPSSRYSLIRVSPKTGRLRQIRRHMKHIFHPIIGDHKHGDNSHNRMFAAQFACTRLMLHAHTLIFLHPTTGQTLCLKADLPEEFVDTLKRIGIVSLENLLCKQSSGT